MEVFSSLIQQLHLDAKVYHNAQVCGDWSLKEHDPGKTCFHMVTLGSCYLEVPGHLETVLNEGDLVIFPRELMHSMRPIKAALEPQQHIAYTAPAVPNGTGMLCGSISFRHCGSCFLLNALPEVFIIRAGSKTCWMKPILNMIIHESLNVGLGSTSIIDRLSELLFIYALRHFLSNNPEQVGVLALYSNARLKLALEAIHAQPQDPWTLESLAQQAAMSRTSFAQAFKQCSGWTAMQYVTWWRMQVAWTHLNQGSSISDTAERVGYLSEPAFSRAFQKQYAISPGKVRRGISA